jgi:GT2 family glycosyltransferase
MISIIIPTFNEEKLIESTLLTLTSALTLPHEVIVSDGGSSDRTVEPVPQELRKPAIWLVPHPGGASGRFSGSASILC